MALNQKKSDERTDKIQILSGLLISDIRKKERSKKEIPRAVIIPHTLSPRFYALGPNRSF